MATTRLLRTSRPLRLGLPSSSSSPSSLSGTTVRCVNTAAGHGFNGDQKTVSGDRERKPMVAVKASLAASESCLTITTSKPQVNWRGLLDLASLLANASLAAVFLLRLAVKVKPRKFYVQMFLERAIIDCRFFTIIAVAGSLLGSVLCFVEGSFIILESYLQYFFTRLSQKMDQEHMVHLLIEAIGISLSLSLYLSLFRLLIMHVPYTCGSIVKLAMYMFIIFADMFLVGAAMLTFGMGLYVMFVGTRSMKEKGPWLSGSNLFGLFSMKTLPTWAAVQSVSQAKSKIGHAVMMILQVGVLEKLKSVNLVTAVDLACFAGAVLMSSASIFLLSRLSAD